MGRLDVPGWNDPFGAAEFFCDDMVLELVSPGLVRVLMLAHEGGNVVVKVKLLLPTSVLSNNICRTQVFMRESELVAG